MGYKTLSAFSLRDLWPSSWGLRGKLVIGLTRDLVADDGKEYPATANLGTGNLSSLGFHWESDITVTDDLATAASIATLPATDTTLPPYKSPYRVYVYDAKGVQRLCLTTKSFHLQSGLPDVFTWREWVDANQFKERPRAIALTGDYDRIRAMIEERVPAPFASDLEAGIAFADVPPVDPAYPTFVGANSYATTSHLGISRPSVAPENPSIPIFVSDNDTRVPTSPQAQALVGTYGTPSSSNPFLTNADPRVMSGFFSAKSPAFGAVGDGVTDDTEALRAWIAAAEAEGGVLYLPPGDYYVNPSSGTEVLLITRPLIFMGGGSRCTTIIVGPDVPTTCDIIRVAPAIPIGPGPVFDDTDLRGYYFRDFGISAYDGSDNSGATPRPGRHALNLDVSAAYTAIYESVIERVYFTDLDGQGVFVDANASPDGIYAFGYSVIRDSTIYNGLNLQGTVDSILIQGNKLRGKNPAVYIYQGVGSTEAVIDNNNITAGGGIIITHAVLFSITRNILEMRYANTVGSDDAVISIHGPTVIGGSIEHNQINTVGSSPNLDGIYLESCEAVEIGPNNYQLDPSKAMVRLHGTDVTNVQLSLRQTFTGGGSPPTMFVLNGATPVYEMVTVEGLYVTALPGRLSIQSAKFGAGTHGHSDYYAGQATPAFGSIASGDYSEYTISRTGVSISHHVDVKPQAFVDPTVWRWYERPIANGIILGIVNLTGAPATPPSINWTWYAELANT